MRPLIYGAGRRGEEKGELGKGCAGGGGEFVSTALIQSITNHGYSKCQRRHSPTQINTYLDVIAQEISNFLFKVLNLL